MVGFVHPELDVFAETPLGQMPGHSKARLTGTDHDDIEQLIRIWSMASVRAGHRAAPRSTVKLNIMPLCMCSAIWQ